MKRHSFLSRAAMMLLVMLLSTVTAWADDVSLQVDNDIPVGTAGHYYVNMPKTGENTLTLTVADLEDGKGTFKVYDNGGKNGEYPAGCHGALIITVPENYNMRLAGTVYAEGNTYDYLAIYDGTDTSHLLGDSKNGKKVSYPMDVTTTDRSARLYFESDNSWMNAGVNLTVTVMAFSTENDVVVNSVTGGSVIASPTPAKTGDVVTLTATPADSYYLGAISAEDASHNAVSIDWVQYSNTATFIMPNKQVTVTPTFLAIPTITVVNPQTGGTISSNLALAMVGETITLTAIPENNYMLDALSVKDANNNTVPVEWTRYYNTASFTMPSVAVTVTPTFTAFPAVTVNNPQEGGTISADVEEALPGSTITLTATPSSDYVLSAISVKDADNNTVAVDWSLLSNTATFTMPEKSVTVTPTFINSGLAINMPKTGVKTVSIPAAVKSFKVYDDGGPSGYYSQGCNGYLILTAPEGYKFQITGTAYTLDTDCSFLTVYDGVYGGTTDAPAYLGDEEKWGENNDPGQDIGLITAKGQSVTLYFYSTSYNSTKPGIDLTVTLVDVTATKAVTVNQASGGTVTANPSPAYPLSTVTLTAQPQGNKVLSDISVKDANNNPIDVKWNLYDNIATFTMPGTAATVSPTFGKTLSTLSANMPKTGFKTVAIPSGATSFKVYDDGGANANYSNECRGYLTLVAPVGYRIQLTGTINSEDTSTGPADYLTVYDGEYNGKGTLPNHLGSKEKWGREASAETIETLTSGGRCMTLYFYSGLADTYSGLNLTASLVEAVEYDVVINQMTGGNMVASPAKSVNGQLVTLTATTDADYVLNGVSVKDANNNDVAVTWNHYSNTATFSMPATAATVTPTYLQLTEDFSVNMPAWGHKNIELPENVKTIKVYDDGGKDGNHTPGCDGTLLLTAPEGYIMEVSGTLKTESDGTTGLSMWDDSKAYGKTLSGGAIEQHSFEDNEPRYIKFTTTGPNLFFFFRATSSVGSPGLDLTVKLINTTEEYNVTVDNSGEGGSVEATPTSGKLGDGITLNATPATGYILNGISAKDADNVDVIVNGGAWYSNNTASFSMPGADVTVTPTFTNDWTANSLSVNVPVHNNTSITIPTGVQSFKVYDHGGANGVYASYCDGSLTLTAPEGRKLQLTGTMKAGTIYDKLSVYDGTSTNATVLLEKTCNKENLHMVTTGIGVVNCSGRYMTIKFKADAASTNAEGLNLTVTVFDPYSLHGVSVANVTNGTVESNVSMAKLGETVTLTATPDNGYALASLRVMDANSNEVPITWNMFENTATFVMPGTVAAVIPAFTSTNPLVINMPRRNTVHATIPVGVTTLKVYDDGGANGPFSGDNDGTLTLTAPANCIMKVFGRMSARHNFDIFRIYNGDDTNTAAALNVTPEKDDVLENIGTFVSDGNVMTFTFYAEYNSAGRSGLDIKVDVIPVFVLDDNSDNASVITDNAGRECNVTIGRTLQAGGWNTFCAPFEISSAQIESVFGAGVKVRELSSSSLSNDVLTLNFAEATTIEAGKPYLVKVASAVADPVFNGVTVVEGTTTTETAEVNFIPVMNPTELTAGDKSVLFIKGGNSLTYPTATANMNGFRAYFQLLNANNARSFNMNFDDGETATGIIELTNTNSTNATNSYYDLQGRKVANPTKGLYIVNGKKIVK